MSPPRSILMVGVEGELRRGLASLIRDRAAEWQFIHARGFLEAMALLAAHPCDAVVAALTLPGFSGGQLLMEVMHRHPRTRRFLLAEPRRLPASPKCSGAAHQVWLQPINAEALLERLTRALARETWCPGESAQRLFARLPAMPTPPEIFFQVEEARQHEDFSADQFTRILAGFPEARQHFLRWTAKAPEDESGAASSDRCALVLLAHLRTFFDNTLPRAAVLESWEAEARMTARLAREIARAEVDDDATAHNAFLGGLLHDTGRLLLDINHPERAATVRRWSHQKEVPLWQAEQTVLGATHADLGACLLSQWGLPWPAVEAVARHHEPEPAGREEFSAATAVRAAVKSVEEWRMAAEPPHAFAPLISPGIPRAETGPSFDLLVHPQAA